MCNEVGWVVAVHLVQLTLMAVAHPVGDVMLHLKPDKLVAHQALHRPYAGVRQSM